MRSVATERLELGGHVKLHLLDRLSGVETLGARPRALERGGKVQSQHRLTR